MPTEVKMPHLGESIDSAVLVAWHKQAGDGVKRGDEIADLETDKATLPLEAPRNGVLLATVAAEGDTVYIGDLLAVIGRAGEAWTPTLAESTQPEPAAKPAKTAEAPASPKRESKRPYKISPLARRKAKELGVDLADLQPADGRKISAADVEAAASAAASMPETSQRRIELSQVKRLTGKRMVESAAVPQFALTIDVAAERLLEARLLAKSRGDELSISAILVHIAARALGEHPLLNARFEDDGITIYESAHIGLATATEAGLHVPVIHAAQSLSLSQVNDKLRQLTDRARQNRLSLNDVTGATFTISNLGMTGITQFTPLVNPPQSAILAVAAPREVLRLDDAGEPVSSKLMALTVACDHRVLDGAEAAAFLGALSTGIETFEYIEHRG